MHVAWPMLLISHVKYNNSLSSYYIKCINHVGAFGSVFQGKYTPNPEESSKAPLDVAVKTIKSNQLN